MAQNVTLSTPAAATTQSSGLIVSQPTDLETKKVIVAADPDLISRPTKDFRINDKTTYLRLPTDTVFNVPVETPETQSSGLIVSQPTDLETKKVIVAADPDLISPRQRLYNKCKNEEYFKNNKEYFKNLAATRDTVRVVAPDDEVDDARDVEEYLKNLDDDTFTMLMPMLEASEAEEYCKNLAATRDTVSSSCALGWGARDVEEYLYIRNKLGPILEMLEAREADEIYKAKEEFEKHKQTHENQMKNEYTVHEAKTAAPEKDAESATEKKPSEPSNDIAAAAAAAPPTQSSGLSERHLAMHKGGRTLVDDSNVSEGNLKVIIEPLLTYARELTEKVGGSIQYLKKASLEDLENHMRNPSHIISDSNTSASTRPPPLPGTTRLPAEITNARVSIRPDAGIIMWTLGGVQYPLYIGEDKVQGTNDQLHTVGKKRQGSGNAIERYFKNVRAEEMLCAHVPYFPSVVFAAGCDFHHTESIAKRLEAGNYGVPNHYVEISPENPADSEEVADQMRTMAKRIRIRKRPMGTYAPFAAIPSVCVKAHKWDALPHNTSLWKSHEYLAVSKRVVELAVKEVLSLAEINI